MKKKQWLEIGLALAFVTLVGWKYFYGGVSDAGGQFNRGAANIEAVATPAGHLIDDSENFAAVRRVIDGDTVELENGERVRYIGIDTPETLDPRKPIQCFGREAAEKNRELVEGKRLRLEKDVTDRDKYNRLLRYVYVSAGESEIFVNLELVGQGFANSYTYPPDIKHQSEFVEAEREAREAGRGLWKSCPVPKENIRLSPTPMQTSNTDSSCKIKGNIGATGEKIYHLPGCGSYEKTSIDESRGEKWFCSEDDAVSAGWRRAKNCP